MTDYKTCSVCKQLLPYANFNNKASSSTGKASDCKPCGQTQKRNLTLEQRERKNAKNRLYRATNKEAVKKTNRQQYEARRQERIKKASIYVRNNRDKHREYLKKSRQNNKHKLAADTRRRNARKRSNGIYKITKKELNRLLSMPCFYCGSKQNQTIDHVIAIARGGTDSIGNLVTACKSCNSRKRQLTIMEWRLKKAKE